MEFLELAGATGREPRVGGTSPGSYACLDHWGHERVTVGQRRRWQW